MEHTPIIEDEHFCSAACPFFNQLNFVDALCKKDHLPIMFFDGFRSHCIVKKDTRVVSCLKPLQAEDTAYDRCI